MVDDFEFFTATASSSGWAPSTANGAAGSRERRGFGYDDRADDMNGVDGMNGINGMDIMDTVAMDVDQGRAGKNSNALRQFWRLPGNHGTPNDLNPGDTYIDEDTLRKRRQQASRRSRRASPANDPSSSSSPSLAEVKAGTTVEIAMLADVISTYLTDRALWRR